MKHLLYIETASVPVEAATVPRN
jgi:hypothetical protein